MVHCKKCHLYAVVHIVNLNNKKGKKERKKKQQQHKFHGCLSTKKFNCNAYIINKCKGEKVPKVLQALFHNSSMAETTSGLKSKPYTSECDHSFHTPLRYCRFFFNAQHFWINHVKIALKICSVEVAWYLFL